MEEKKVIVFDIDNTIFIYDDDDHDGYNHRIHPVFINILKLLDNRIDIFYYTNGETWKDLKEGLMKINSQYVDDFDNRVFHLDNVVRRQNMDKIKSQNELILCLNNYYNSNQYEFEILMFDDCGIQNSYRTQEQRIPEAKKSPTFKHLFSNNTNFTTYVVQYYSKDELDLLNSNNEMLDEIKKFAPTFFSDKGGGKIKYRNKSKKKRHHKKSKKKRHHKKSKKTRHNKKSKKRHHKKTRRR